MAESFDQNYLENLFMKWKDSFEEQMYELKGDENTSIRRIYDILDDTHQELQKQTKTLQELVKDLTASSRNFSTNTSSRATGSSRRDSGGNDTDVGFSVPAMRTQNSLLRSQNVAFGNLVNSTKNLRGNMTELAQTFGITSGAVYAIFENLEKTTDTLRTFRSVGATFGGDLADFYGLVGDARMSMDDFQNVVQNSSKSISELGLETFVDLQDQVRKSLRPLGMLGLTTEEVAKYTSEYVEIQRRAGTIDQMNQRRLSRRTTNFAKTITELSQATGKAREEILNEVSEQMRQPYTQAALRSLPEEMRQTFTNMNATLSQVNPGLSEIFSRVTAGLPAGTSEFAKQLGDAGLNAIVSDIANLSRDMRRGQATQQDAARLIDQSLVLIDEQMSNARLATQEFETAAQLRSQLEQFRTDRLDADKEQGALLTTLQNLQDAMGTFTSTLYRVTEVVLKPFEDNIVNISEDVKDFANVLNDAVTGLAGWYDKLGETTKQITVLSGAAAVLFARFKIVSNIIGGLGRIFGYGSAGRARTTEGGTSNRSGTSTSGSAAGRSLLSRGGSLVGRVGKGLLRGGAIGLATGIGSEAVRYGGSALGLGEQTTSTLGKATSFGGMGAMIGSVFGPVGTALGAGLGAITGAIMANVDSFEEAWKKVTSFLGDIQEKIDKYFENNDLADIVFDTFTRFNPFVKLFDMISEWLIDWSPVDKLEELFTIPDESERGGRAAAITTSTGTKPEPGDRTRIDQSYNIKPQYPEEHSTQELIKEMKSIFKESNQSRPEDMNTELTKRQVSAIEKLVSLAEDGNMKSKQQANILSEILSGNKEQIRRMTDTTGQNNPPNRRM